MATILIGDDDQKLLEAVRREFTSAGHDVVLAANGRDLLEAARRDVADAIVIGDGIDLPSGREVCRLIREELPIPIIMMFRRADEFDRIVALELGADEYLVGPVSARELLARIRALFRRAHLIEQQLGESNGSVLRDGSLSLDLRQHQVWLAGKCVALKPKEFDLLAFLMSHPGELYTRDQLIGAVWGRDLADSTRTVDIHISFLREKIEADPSRPLRLQTVRRVGYRYVPRASSAASDCS